MKRWGEESREETWENSVTLTHAHLDLDQKFLEALRTACRTLNLISLLFMVIYNIYQIIYSINQITLGDMNT